MLIQSINPFLNIKNASKQGAFKKTSVNIIKKPINCPTYPKEYFINQISFGKRLRAPELINRIGEENFPSREIIKTLRYLGNTRYFSLYDIHIDNYRDLTSCKTLEEAKELYPEFEGVIDAKDIDPNSIPSKSLLYKIIKGKAEGIDVNNFSLEILKRYYAQMLTGQKSENYFGIGQNTLRAIFKELNIPKMADIYIRNVVMQNPELCDKQSRNMIHHWEKVGDEPREALRNRVHRMTEGEAGKKRLEMLKTDEFRKLCSNRAKEIWEADDGTMRETYRQRMKQRWAEDDGTMLMIALDELDVISQSPEILNKRNNAIRSNDARKKMSKSQKLFNKEHPEYAMAKSLAFKRHPEITSELSRIAKKHIGLGEVLHKKQFGEELTPNEQSILLRYYGECAKVLKGYNKLIGQEYHNILVEWGIVSED